MNLDDQVAIVTGAGSADGIGFACATALAADGAHVVIASTTDRIHDRVDELQADGLRGHRLRRRPDGRRRAPTTGCRCARGRRPHRHLRQQRRA